MAKPKIFLSSTYFDLRQVRGDLERFIRDQGYDPVLNEKGHIPYGKEEKLEEYCYKEISNIDILVSIIGGRFGSSSNYSSDSISNLELKTALESSKQVYIFIDKNVYSEYTFYTGNKENENLKFTYADNVKIFHFIEFVESLPNNNTIQPFETSMDIIRFLREQWAGLFQRFLQEQTRIKEINVIKGIENTAKTLDQLVTFLTEEKRDKDNTINQILLNTHPAMQQVKELMRIPFRVFFTTFDELNDLMIAYSYKFDDSSEFRDNFSWQRDKGTLVSELIVSQQIFNENKLKIYTQEEWESSFISLRTYSKQDDDDDLPF